MPPMSTAVTFIRALQTRRTATTQALETVFANNSSGSAHPLHGTANYDSLKSEGLQSSPTGGLANWAKNALVNAGIARGPALDHVDAWVRLWSSDQAAVVRDAVVSAIDDNRSIKFFWDLHSQVDEETDIDAPAAGDFTITFKSPRWKVRVVAPDNIAVDV